MNKQDYYNAGVVLIANQVFPEAVKMFTACIDAGGVKDFPDVIKLRGQSYMAQGKLNEAIADFSFAIAKNSHDSSLYFMRGNVFKSLMQFEQAIHDYSKTIALNANHVKAFLSRASSYEAIGKWSRANKDFKQLKKLYPNSKHFRELYTAHVARWANHEYDHENFNRALDLINEAIALLPEKNAILYYNRAEILVDLNRLQEAMRDLNESIHVAPMAKALNARGLLKRTLKLPDAIKDFLSAKRLAPQDETYRNNCIVEASDQAHSSFAERDFKKTITYCNIVLKLDPNKLNVLVLRAQSYYEVHDFKLCVSDYNKAIAINPADGFLYNGRALAKSQLKEYKAAIEDFTKAHELEPSNSVIVENLIEEYKLRAERHYKLKHYDAAKADYTKIIELNPNDADAYYFRGNCAFILKDFKNGLVDYDKGILLKPDAVKLSHRAEVKRLLGDMKGAIRDYEQALKLDMDHANIYQKKLAEFWFLIGKDYLQRKDSNQAKLSFDHSIRYDAKQSETYRLRGECEQQLGKSDEAIADFTVAINLNPTAQAYNNRAVMYENMNQFEKAVADFESALLFAPNDSVIKRNLALSITASIEKFLPKKEYKKIIKLMDKALAIDPNIRLAYSYRGYAKKQLGDSSGEQDIQHAIHLIDENETRHFSDLGFAKQLAGDFEGALAAYNEDLRLHPNDNTTVGIRNSVVKKMQDNLRHQTTDSAVLTLTASITLIGIILLLARYYFNKLKWKKKKAKPLQSTIQLEEIVEEKSTASDVVISISPEDTDEAPSSTQYYEALEKIRYNDQQLNNYEVELEKRSVLFTLMEDISGKISSDLSTLNKILSRHEPNEKTKKFHSAVKTNQERQSRLLKLTQDESKIRNDFLTTCARLRESHEASIDSIANLIFLDDYETAEAQITQLETDYAKLNVSLNQLDDISVHLTSMGSNLDESINKHTKELSIIEAKKKNDDTILNTQHELATKITTLEEEIEAMLIMLRNEQHTFQLQRSEKKQQVKSSSASVISTLSRVEKQEVVSSRSNDDYFTIRRPRPYTLENVTGLGSKLLVHDAALHLQNIIQHINLNDSSAANLRIYCDALLHGCAQLLEHAKKGHDLIFPKQLAYQFRNGIYHNHEFFDDSVSSTTKHNAYSREKKRLQDHYDMAMQLNEYVYALAQDASIKIEDYLTSSLFHLFLQKPSQLRRAFCSQQIHIGKQKLKSAENNQDDLPTIIIDGAIKYNKARISTYAGLLAAMNKCHPSTIIDNDEIIDEGFRIRHR